MIIDNCNQMLSLNQLVLSKDQVLQYFWQFQTFWLKVRSCKMDWFVHVNRGFYVAIGNVHLHIFRVKPRHGSLYTNDDNNNSSGSANIKHTASRGRGENSMKFSHSVSLFQRLWEKKWYYPPLPNPNPCLLKKLHSRQKLWSFYCALSQIILFTDTRNWLKSFLIWAFSLKPT